MRIFNIAMIRLLLLFTFLFTLSLKAEPSPSPDLLKVVDWNIQWFPGGSMSATPEQGVQQMSLAQDIITALNPDILLCQEIRDWDSFKKLVSKTPGLKPLMVSQFNGRQQVAIAAKLPADSSWAENWQSGKSDPPRGFAFAALDLPDGRILLTYVVHMKSNLGEFPLNVAKRQDAAEQLVKHWKEMTLLYGKRGIVTTLIGGDFNTSFDDPRFKDETTLPLMKASDLSWIFADIPFAERVTLPASDGYLDACFDHLFYSGLNLQKIRVIPCEPVSDHRPIEATFKLLKGLDTAAVPAAR